MNPPKVTRGVQEADVWAAADALLAQGLRPTIERVRQQIGRGSPNTVSPMLESWFATLGQRLGVVQTDTPQGGVPEPVLRLAQELWESASAQAMDRAQQALHEREAALQASRLSHEADLEHMEQREKALHQQKQAMDEAMKLARAQAQELSRRLDEMQQLAQDREAQLSSLRAELAAASKARELERKEHSEEQQAAAQERQRLAEQFAGNERRMLTDLDRARQEVASAKKAQAEQERKSEARLAEWQTRQQHLEEELLQARSQLLGAQQSAQAAQDRVADLKALLSATQSSSAPASATDKNAAPRTGSRSLQRRALAQRARNLPRK
ncbi:DNA-binding protein [Comamonas endophytica]|uniref:DNA-binding protein n=1 Tax=Comamonas endophytica TaxID=2949090 RepID=A0ABY6G9Q6_9BURK|nr:MULTISPECIES: DNA-binding protein [unclassified Acidovorax]MCD2511888.1 DNA-binding protein [Acidovorax sp. D4N7]UYG51608.1 DNA-binding protein [Acidovorax sp. 5MLIR]